MWNKLLILLLLPSMCIAETMDCKDMRKGIFKAHGLYGSLNTIIRTNEKQTETWGKTGNVIEYDIQWTSDCTYILFNRQILKGKDSLVNVTNKDTLYNEIVEASKYWHKIACIKNDSGPKVVEDYFIVDTTSTYKDLNDLDKLKDYNGTSGGGTFVGYNYAIKYKEHSSEPGKFRFVFLEALIINDMSKFKVLDTYDCILDTSQKIAISNCRYNGKYDKEIMAVYISENSKDEASILMAKRFNKRSLKIEEVDADKVKYKVADKKKLIKSE